MTENTLKQIRDIAITLLYTDIHPTNIPFIATHPFTNNYHVTIPNQEGQPEWVDLHEEEKADVWRRFIKTLIKNSTMQEILLMINYQYALTYIKYCADCLNDKELGEALGFIWDSIENISGDVNVFSKELVKMFKRADKYSLMSPEDYAVYESLPDEIVVYRGVTDYNKKYTKAMSWTLDKEKAKWFADRYQTGIGEVWEKTVPKKKVLAYFGGRDESEVVINPY